jgi:hypothetical protein
MSGAPRRILRLVGLDLRVGLATPWYYVTVAAMAFFVVVFSWIYPARERLAVLVTGDLSATAAERVAASLSRDGFRVETQVGRDVAADRLARDRALGIVRFDRSGAVEAHIRDARLLPEARRALRIASLRAIQTAYEAAARRRGIAAPAAAVRSEDALAGTSSMSLDLAGVAARSAWILSAFWCLVTAVLLRGSAPRFRRTYAAHEIVAARAVACTLIMLPSTALAFAIPPLLGFPYPHPGGLVLPLLAATASGALLGTLFAALLATRPPHEDRSVIACVVALFVIYVGCDAGVGGFSGEVSEAAMAPLQRALAPGNFTFQVYAIAKLALFAPEGAAAAGLPYHGACLGLSSLVPAVLGGLALRWL